MAVIRLLNGSVICFIILIYSTSGTSPRNEDNKSSMTELHNNGKINAGTEIKSTGTRNSLKRSKRGIFDIFTFGLDLGFNIYGIASGVLDGEEQEAQMEKVLEGLEKNFEAIQKNYVAIKDVGIKVDDVMASIVKFNTETYTALTDIRREILKANADTQTALGEIKLDIFKLNRELLQQFEGMHDELQELRVGDKISSLLTFMEYFWQHVETIEQLSNIERVFELERATGILFQLEEAVGHSGMLHANLYHILNENLAYPSNDADIAAYTTLTVLYHGVQTYVTAMFFTVEQEAFLADFYYQQGDIDNCNKYLMRMLADFKEFNVKLLGNKNSNGLIIKVLDLYKVVNELPFVFDNSELLNIYLRQLAALQQAAALVEKARLPILDDQPNIIKRKPDFSTSAIATPIGKWQKGAEVSYAVQFNSNDSFSKIGYWSEPYTVSSNASPRLYVPRDNRGRRRLIFRKFQNSQPQLVGVLEAAHLTSFHDINRDLYNAAGNLNEEIALHEFETFLKSGADANATFEDNRSLIHAAAAAGNALLIEKFLLATAFDVLNAKDSKGNTPLHIAADAGYENVVELLLKNGAAANAATNLEAQTPLHIAALKGYELVIAALLANNQTQVNAHDAQGFRPLHSAVYGGVYALEALLANNQTAINAQSNEGLTALQLSVLSGNVDVFNMLLNCAEIDLNIKSAGNFTALHFAVIQKNFEQFTLLLKQPKIDVNAVATNDWRSLHFVIALQLEDMLAELLKHQAIDVNAKAAGNVTALHIAAKLECLVCLELLLKSENITIDAVANGELTPLHLAALFGKSAAIATLTEYGAAMERQAEYAFKSKFCYYAKQRQLTNSNRSCASIETTKYVKLTPLLLASISSHCNAATLKVLIEKGANSTALSDDGKTFEFMVARHGTLECVDYILKQFDGLNLKNEAGDSLLHSAVSGHNWPVLKFLLENKKFNVDLKNLNDETALHWATQSNDADLVKYLLMKGAAVNAATKLQKNTSLHFAVESGNLEMIEILTQNGADINAVDASHKSPLHYAVLKNNSLEIAELLLKGNSPETALCAAVQAPSLEVVKFLLNRFQNLAVAAAKICFPLHVAAKDGSLSVLELLSTHGLNIRSKDAAQNTPLHYAAQAKQMEVVKYLVTHGAAVNDEGNDKQTPLHLAFKNNNCEIAKYLLEFGHAAAYARDIFQRTVVDVAANSKCYAQILPFTTTTTTTTTPKPTTTTKKPKKKKCHMGPMTIFYGPVC